MVEPGLDERAEGLVRDADRGGDEIGVSRILSVSTIATPRGDWVEPRWEQQGDNCRIPGTASPEFRD
jgi:hypothetical protein